MATDTKPHICVKCGKTIKPGEEYSHLGKVYCCSKCCNRKDTPKNVCEFC